MEFKEKIRSILVRMPRATKWQLGQILSIDKDVALRLRNEVQAENTKRIEDQLLNEEVGKMQTIYEEVITECWRILSQGKMGEGGIVLEPFATNQEKASALRTIVLASKGLFEVKFDAGVFKRKLGEIGINLGETEKDLILKAVNYAIGRGNKTDNGKGGE